MVNRLYPREEREKESGHPPFSEKPKSHMKLVVSPIILNTSSETSPKNDPILHFPPYHRFDLILPLSY